MDRYLDSSLRSQQPLKKETIAPTVVRSEKVDLPEELGSVYASPEEVFMEEHGPLCGLATAAPIVTLQSAESLELVTHAVHTTDDIAWMSACKNWCNKPCKKHASLFLKPNAGIKMGVDAKDNVKVHVDEVLPAVWVSFPNF